MWLAIAVYVVAAGRHAHRQRSTIRVESLRISIVDTTASRVVTTEKVRQWLSEAAIDPIGRTIDSTDTRTIELHLAARPEVRHVSAWTDLGGALTVRIAPRQPAMRVRTNNGYRFWYTDDGVIIPDRGEFTAHTPVVTGTIPFPFGPATEGSYAQMQRTAYDDFLARFTALDTERRELESRSAAITARIRTIRTSTPRRWWSENRRSNFKAANTTLVAELEKEQREAAAQLRRIARLEAELREKEKNSQQSLRFLSKLANFVEFIGTSHFWNAQIVQINVVEGAEVTDPEKWREPHLELIPRAGNHTVVLGELDGTERERLENLRLFYRRTLWHEGWEAYSVINIKYQNQIVCTK